MLIALGIIVNIYIPFQDRFGFILEVLGTVGLILIVLDGALGLKLLRSKTGIILKSLFVSLITLVGTSYISALFLYYFFDLPIIHSRSLNHRKKLELDIDYNIHDRVIKKRDLDIWLLERYCFCLLYTSPSPRD